MRRDDIVKIIKGQQIQTRFQSIVNLENGEIYGYESLTRIDPNPTGATPDDLFEGAMREGLIHELDALCRRSALTSALQHNITDKKLFVNLIPNLLEDSGYRSGQISKSLKDTGFPIENIVIEFTERATGPMQSSIADIVKSFREEGFLIALDDLGAGQAGLNRLVELEPDIVKLDRFLITEISQSFTKKMLLRSVCGLCRSLGILVIAEGIETLEELRSIHALGGDLGQGYLFGKPSLSPTVQNTELVAGLDTGPRNDHIRHSQTEDSSCSALASHVPTVGLDDITQKVHEIFENHPNLLAVPVVDQSKAVGLFRRRDFQARLRDAFGRDHFLSKPASQTMRKEPLLIDVFMELGVAAEAVLRRDPQHIYEPFVICHNGDEYVGLGLVHKLLERISKLRYKEALAANPLTALPGNLSIVAEMERRLELKGEFAVIYLDLDHFKPFNDYFGFQKGDMAIVMLAEIIKTAIQPGEFIGHIGGDDFIWIGPTQRVEAVAELCARTFNERIRSYYSIEEWKRGFIEIVTRFGKTVRFRPMTLSLACLLYCRDRFKSVLEITNTSAEVKAKAKDLDNTCFVLDDGGTRLVTHTYPHVGLQPGMEPSTDIPDTQYGAGAGRQR